MVVGDHPRTAVDRDQHEATPPLGTPEPDAEPSLLVWCPTQGRFVSDLLRAPAPVASADRATSAITPTTRRVVLDTSVLISDPDSVLAFPDADAVIPLVVIEELDQHKSRMDDVGRSAR